MNKSDLSDFRHLLLSLQSQFRGDVAQIADAALDRSEGGGDSRSPTHIAELGTDTYEQDFSLGVVERDQGVLDEISAALKRIDEGTFGVCQSCLEEGKPPSKAVIKKSRLRAIPYARNCIECERKREEFAL